jgi:hypothetical protein
VSVLDISLVKCPIEASCSRKWKKRPEIRDSLLRQRCMLEPVPVLAFGVYVSPEIIWTC